MLTPAIRATCHFLSLRARHSRPFFHNVSPAHNGPGFTAISGGRGVRQFPEHFDRFCFQMAVNMTWLLRRQGAAHGCQEISFHPSVVRAISALAEAMRKMANVSHPFVLDGIEHSRGTRSLRVNNALGPGAAQLAPDHASDRLK